ncbi:glycosyltransferase family 87 protein [Thermoflexus sp.]|uniref:glycosyltransferase family 87 protein n=1 Tax=Thermoflexus sp. TaxID=1969742 RepID=UPI002636B0B0|nr:glycosyltransferase family 87 protein [Thermoflexus sp.]MCX7691111.1 DUF2029 domain-containing protein [Thermoflexus sp.]
MRWLTPARLRYAWIAGAALWGGWLLSLLLGQNHLDRTGQVIGTDYLQFYAAGWMIRHGQAARLYDPEAQLAAERMIIGPHLPSYHAFLNPPFFALLFVPFSLLPYELSFALWSLLQVMLLALSLRALRSGHSFWKSMGWALTFLPVFASVSFGQNGLLSLALLTGVWRLWRKGHDLAAGGAAGLLLYKPHLLLGLLALWMVEGPRGRRAFLGFLLMGAALFVLSLAVLPEATWAYLSFAGAVYPDLPSWKAFPLWHLHSLRGFWRLLLPWWPRLADLLAALAALVGVIAVFRFWRSHRDPGLRFALAVALTLWLTPHAMIYDWAILILPAAILEEALPSKREEQRAIFAGIWLAAFLSAPLVLAARAAAGIALMPTLPTLAWGGWRVFQMAGLEIERGRNRI